MSQILFNERKINGVPALKVSGRLDIDTAPEMRNVILHFARTGHATLAVDLSGLDYMDTSGLATLIEGNMRMQYAGGRLILFGLTPQTAEVFNMVHVSGLFTIVETEKEAKDLLNRPAQ